MYEAQGNEVWYYHPVKDMWELFVTIHPTSDCVRTPEEQAIIMANMFNSHASKAA